MSAPFLLEIGMEECPARFVDRALRELATGLTKSLTDHRLKYESVRTLGTPRRLTVIVTGLAERQDDLHAEVKGPPVRIAFDKEGNPTKAALGFAANQGVAVDALVQKETDGGAYLYAVKEEVGRAAAAVLVEVLGEVVASLRFPKSMRWDESSLRFARPIRWVVALLDERVIEFEVAGVKAGRVTYGHRFLSPEPIELAGALEYEDALRNRGHVVVDVDARREMIRTQSIALGDRAGGTVAIDDQLLAEVTHLVEYPTPLLGSFDPAFLEVPSEILVTTMREHQKYFPVRANDGALLPHFVAVRNGGADSLERVQSGNERVLAARLSDARFFYDEDRKKPLEAYTDALRSVLFQEQLGTVWEKVERVRATVENATRASEKVDAEVLQQADRAAQLCKADLVTQVVYEFPELQGMMGREYARLSGEAPVVADAIFEHYLPRFAQDDLPRSLPGALVALADKTDTIVGCFGIGLIPTGSTDPYALRRQALGILRILLQLRPPVTLGALIDASLKAYGERLSDHESVRRAVMEFFAGRLSTLFSEREYRYDLIEATLANGIEDPVAAEGRLLAFTRARESGLLSDVVTSFHRAVKLAASAQHNEVDPELFEDKAEQALLTGVERLEDKVPALIEQARFDDAIGILAALKSELDAFFDAVLIMADDPAVKGNRLALLGRVVTVYGTLGAWEHIAED